MLKCSYSCFREHFWRAFKAKQVSGFQGGKKKKANNRKILIWSLMPDLGERKAFLSFYLKTFSTPMLWDVSKQKGASLHQQSVLSFTTWRSTFVIFGISASKIPKEPLLSSHGRWDFPCLFNWTSLWAIPGLDGSNGPFIGNVSSWALAHWKKRKHLVLFQMQKWQEVRGKKWGINVQTDKLQQRYG